MVHIEFERTGHNHHKVGPVPWVKLNAGSLRVGPDNHTAARYHDGVWCVEGNDNVTRFDINGSRCLIRFGGDGTNAAIHGPFDKVEVVDGAVYTQPDRQLLARLDEGNRLWFTYEDQRYWPVLVIADDEEDSRPTSEPADSATTSRPPRTPPV
jgi:hypothetical protein